MVPIAETAERPDIFMLPNLLTDRIDEWYLKRARTEPSETNRSSAIGEECLRSLVYSRREEARLAIPPDKGLLKIFWEGNQQERAAKEILTMNGFNLQEEERKFGDLDIPEPKIKRLKPQVSCHIEGYLARLREILDVDLGMPRVLMEIKGLNDQVWQSICGRSVADSEIVNNLKSSKFPFARKYPEQVNTCMWLSGEPYALFILKNKAFGAIRFAIMPFDPELRDLTVDKCLQINGYLRDNTLPPQIENLDHCRRCQFRLICQADLPKEEVTIGHIDEDHEAMLDRIKELEPLVDEYSELKGAIQAFYAGCTAKSDRWEVQSKSIFRKAYTSYVKETTYFKTTWKERGTL